MFINIHTGRETWLISQDGDGQVTYSHDAPDKADRHHTGAPAATFFAAHREATRDEIDGIGPGTRPRTVKETPPKAAKKPATRKPVQGSRKSSRTAAPAAPAAPGADKSAGGSRGSPAGESK